MRVSCSDHGSRPGVSDRFVPRSGVAALRRPRAFAGRAAAALAALALALPASAQIQRSFVNLSFEQPAAATSCFFIVGGDAINGWSSTHPAPGTNNYCAPNITAATPGVTTGGQIEVWSGGFSGVTSLAGVQHAELNASQSSRLFQTVCMINGESVTYTLGHRGRSSATNVDVAEFNIDSAANSVVRSSTSAGGTGGVTQCGSTTVAATNGPVSGANDGIVASPTCSSATAGNGWRRYTGTFTFNGTTGNHSVGFESISTAGGDNTVGNFLDDVDITLKPVLELTSATFTTREGQPTTAPTITIVGNVPAGGLPLTINVAAGTATLGTDFTANTTFTIPAGNYQTPTAIPLTGVITVLDDTLVEDNETINLTVGASTGYVLSSTNTCNAAAQATATVIILDNDVDVRTTKTVTNANPPAGGTTTFTVTYGNHTAQPGTGPTNAHDATVNLADALPTGFTAFSWTCASGGSPAPTCPAASGTGAISAAATLPAGTGAGAGGFLTYTITGTVSPSQCAATTNTATATVSGVFAEATGAQAGFNTPVPGGTANNSASVDIDPACLTLDKTTQGGAGGPFTFALTNTAQASGTATTATAGTPVQVDGNAAAGTQPYGVSAPNTAITINESALPAGFLLAGATCSDGVSTVGSLSGTTYTIPAGSVTPGTDFTCTYTNGRVGNVTLVKALAPTSDTGVFNLSVDGTGVATNVGNAGTGTLNNIPAGATVTIAETAGTATSLANYSSSWSCTGGAGSGTGASGTFTMPGSNVTCTFTNTRLPRVTITKISNGSVGAFPFSGDNGFATHTITTVTPGTGVAGPTQTLAAASTATTITEAATPGFSLTGINCTGLGAGSANTSLGARTVTLNAAATAAGNNIACTFTNTAIVDLSITKTATPSGTYLAGQPISYSIVATNTGAAAVSGVSITDTVPASITGVTWTCTAPAGSDCDTTVAGTGATGSGNAIALDNVSLAAGAAATVTVNGTVALTTTGSIVNTATVTPPSGSTCTILPCTRTATATNTDGGTPQLSLAKTATPTTFAIGQAGTYSIQVSNTGTSSTAGTITVSDPMPASIVITATPSGTGWNCAASTTTNVSCTTAAVLPPGANAPVISVPVMVNAGAAQPSTNTATASGGNDATCPAATHCQGSVTTPINAPRLDVTKVLQGNLVVGVQSNYLITVTNNGLADTLAGTVSDTVPAGLTIGVLPGGCTSAGQVVTCQIPAGIAAGTSVSYAIPVTPQPATVGTSVTNNAVANGGGDPSCPAAAHCTGTTTDSVSSPQLTLAKSASPPTFVVGVTANYILTLTNTGTAPTTAIATISDTIPGGLAIGTLPAGCTAAGQVVTCTVAAGLATGSPVSFSIPVTPDASLNGLSVTNTATASGGGDPSCPVGGPFPTRCQPSVTTPVNAARLDIVKTASGNFIVGVPGSYTLTVTNNGTAATSAAATVSDMVPGDLVIGTLPAGCTRTGQTVTCTIPPGLAAGASTSFVIPVTPTAAAIGQNLSNTATVNGGGDPSCPGQPHCSSTTNTPVNAPALQIEKSASSANFVVGVPASYTLTVTNVGTAATTAATTVTDNVPGSLTLGTLPAGCTAAGQAVTCTIPAGLATGAPVSFVIPVTPTAAANGTTLSNTANANGGGDPTCPAAARCSDTELTPVQAPRLAITKTASGNFVVGVPGSYTLTVTNTGTAATTAPTTVTDNVPASLTLGTLPAGCTATGQTVTCTIAAGLANGTPVSFVIPVTPTPAAIGQTLSNTASITGGGDPGCPGDPSCTSTVTTPVNSPALTLTKTASQPNFTVGVPASYTLTVTNNGTAATTAAATVTDTIPTNLTIGTLPAGCTAAGQTVTCTIAAGLATGTSTSFVIPVTPAPAANGQTLTNTATVSGGGDPTCPATARCTSTVNTPTQAPQLTITKTANPANFVVGVPATYTLGVTNTGTAATTATATVTDTLPASLTPGTMPANCSNAGQVVTCTIAAGFAAGANTSFVIPVIPTAAALGTTLTNTATVSGGGDPGCPAATHCTSTVNTPVNAPQLDIDKTASSGTFTVGVPASYTLAVTNSGTAATTAAATISDTVPAGLLVGAAPAGCTVTGQDVSCTIAAGLAAGAGTSFVIPVTPLPASAGSTLANTASVSGGGDPTCPAAGHCTDTVTTPVALVADLAITKTANPNGTYLPGQAISYTITVINNGPSPVADVHVTDPLPAAVTGATWTCTATNASCGAFASGAGSIDLIDVSLDAGGSVTFVVDGTVDIAAFGNIVNTATAEPPAGTTCSTPPCTRSATVTNIDSGNAQLSVTKTATPTTFAVGQAGTYSIQVSNTGTSSTSGTITIADPMPASIVITATPSGTGWNCAASTTTNVSCTTTAVLPPGSNAPVISVPVMVNAGAAQPSTNTATASGGGDATCPDATHCQGSVTTPINAPRLDVTKVLQGNLVVGVQSNYLITVTNNGLADTLAGTITDTVPTGLTLGVLPAGCTSVGQTVTCQIPAGIAVGTSVSYAIPVTPQPSIIGTSVTNNAVANGGGDPSCPAAAHCTGTTTDSVSAPQLTLAKSASPPTFVVGVTANYVLTLTNTGTAPTTAVATISDTIPGGLTIGTLPAGCTAAGQVVTCTVAAGLATGSPVSFSIPVTPDASLNGLSVTNTATASGGGDPSCPVGGPFPTRCQPSVTTPVNAARLDITKTASGNFVVGVQGTYTLSVTNNGTAATSAAAAVTDVVPADLVIGTLPAGCTRTGQTVTCTIPSGLAAGASTSFVIPVTPTAAAIGQNLSNTATVNGGGDPSCPGQPHCASTTTTPVDAPALQIEKSASSTNFVVGVPASYTLTVTNTGTAATTAASTVTDNVPGSLTLGTLPAGCTATGQTVTCTIPAGLATGTPVSFVIPVTPTAAANGTTLSNTATVNGGGDPTCPAASRCSDTELTPVQAPRLAITKTASGNFVVGVPGSYTLTVTNTGTAATTAPTTVTDNVPASLTLGTLPAGCTATGNTVTCTIAAGLANGTPVSFVIPVTPTPAAVGQTLSNTASITGGGDPGCPGDPSCTSTTNTPVNAPALTITKTANPTTFVVGVPANYLLTVTNNGTAATTAATTVTDTIPTNLTIGTLPAGCTAAGQTVTCTIAAGLATGTSTAFTIPVTPTPAADGQTLTNTATVSGGGDPTCPAASRCSSTVNTPTQAPQLTITKTANPTNFVVGVPATYTLGVTNTGTAATTATATVTDTLPASLTPGTMPAGCSNAGAVVTCTVPAGFAAGANTSFVIPVIPTAAALGTTLTNSATVSGGGDPSCPAATHCTSTVNTPVNAPQLDIDKTASSGTFTVGVPATYTLTVTNSGTAATTAAATVSDTLPAGLAIGTMPAGCTIGGQTVTCTIAAGFAAGASTSFVIPVTPTPAANGLTLSNTATVSGGGDPTCPAAGHCTDTVTTPVATIADLVVTKTATPNGTYLPGQSLSYTITVVNNGPSPIAGVTVTDTVPALVTVSGWTCTATNGDCDTTVAGTGATGTGNAISLVNVALDAGGSLAIAVSGTADLSATGSIVNTVTATPPAGTTCSTPPCSRSATVTNTDGGAPQLALTKTAAPTTFAVGQPASYTLQVRNTGSSSTSGALTIDDPLPAGITATGTPSGTNWNCAAGTPTNVSCTSNVVLLPGSNAPVVTVPVAIAPGTPSPAVNTARASGGGDAACPADAHCAGTTTTPVNAPRLDVTKTLQGNFVVGVQTNYLITVTNNGQADTLAGTLTDTIPTGLTIGILPPECTSAGQTVTCTIAAGIAAGNAVTYLLPVTPQPSVDGQNLVNNAVASGGGDATCPLEAHCTGTTSNTVSAPQLSLTKTANPTAFVVGVPATYTLTVVNNGTAATTAAATVTDTLPGGLTLGTLPAGCTATGQIVTCTIAAGLATGTPVVFDIPVTPQAGLNGLSVTNTANVDGGGDPGCPSGGPLATRCQAEVTTPVNAAQLTLVKTASATNFVVGVPASYQLTVTNTGAAATTAVATVVDTVPADLVIGTLPPDCTAAGQTVTCTIAAGLAVGAPVTFTIPVTPTAAANGQQLVNTATISGGGDPSCPGAAHCTSTTTTPVDAPALTIVKTASATSFVIGVPASYTLTVTNTGSAATTAAATVSDTIPGNLTLGAPLPPDCTATGQVVSCTIAAGLATNTPVAFTLPVTPTAAASGTTLSNTAAVNGGGDPGCPSAARCTSTVTTPVNAPRIEVVKTASTANFVVGVPASYTLTVTNTGTAATTAPVTLSDNLPSNVNIGTLPAGCTAGGNLVTCTIAAGLATNTPVSFTIPVTPTAAANGTTLTNTATVTGGGDPTCPGATTCSSTVDTPVNAPQLTLVKTASGGVFVVGAAASYTLTVTNTGSAPTTAVATVSDNVPGTLVIGTLPAGCTATGQAVTCTIPAGLATNSPVSFVIPVTPTAAASGTTVTNTATVSGGGDPSCPAAAHCSGTVDVPVDAPQLDVTKTASTNAFVVGTPATYTITVTNTGSAATTAAATITDNVSNTLTLGTLPAGCTASANVVTCTIAAGLAPNASVSFVIPVTPTPAANGTSIVNQATVSGGGDPTCPAAAHCSGTVTVPANAPQLTIAKTASAPVFVVGTPASYTLTVTNTGNAATTAPATINDSVPGALTIGTLPAGCTAVAQQVTCTVAAGLAPNAPVSFVIPVTPTPAASGTVLVNTATVSGGGDPSCPQEAHCTSDVAVPVDAPLLNIVKTASVASFTVGEAASYTLTVTNAGSAATTAAASVTDPVSASLTLGAMPAGCSATGQSVTCVIAPGLAAGASVSFVIPVTPNATAGGVVTNTATVTGGGDSSCPQATHCSGTVDVPVGEAADLSLVKNDGGIVTAPGGTIAYTLTVTNAGPSAATNVSVTDAFPAGLTYVSAGGADWTCNVAGTTLTCTRPTMANGTTSVIDLVLAVPASYAGPNPIVNTASVSSPTNDPNPDNNSGTTPTPLGDGAADLSVTKSDGGATVVAGGNVTYTIAVSNAGPSDAANVRIDDPTPPGLTLVSTSAPCAGGFPCTIPSLAAGASITLTTTYHVPVDYRGPQPIANTATATSGTPDPDPANNSSTDTTPVHTLTTTVPVPGVGPIGLLALGLGLVAVGGAWQRRRRAA